MQCALRPARTQLLRNIPLRAGVFNYAREHLARSRESRRPSPGFWGSCRGCVSSALPESYTVWKPDFFLGFAFCAKGAQRPKWRWRLRPRCFGGYLSLQRGTSDATEPSSHKWENFSIRYGLARNNYLLRVRGALPQSRKLKCNASRTYLIRLPNLYLRKRGPSPLSENTLGQ